MPTFLNLNKDYKISNRSIIKPHLLGDRDLVFSVGGKQYSITDKQIEKKSKYWQHFCWEKAKFTCRKKSL